MDLDSLGKMETFVVSCYTDEGTIFSAAWTLLLLFRELLLLRADGIHALVSKTHHMWIQDVFDS
jgi:hypothetical protein